MADLTSVIETMEHRLMRAWVNRDLRVLKSLTWRGFRMLTASEPCVLLDSRSWLEGVTTRYHCTSYRFGDVYVRDMGSAALFASKLDLKATMDGHDMSGEVWITDVWRKSRVRRAWRITERIVSKVDDDRKIPGAMRSLQLWR